MWLGVLAHTVGGYYTFQEVPLGNAFSNVFGFERNYYDRIGHFLCGCYAYPLMELACRKKWFRSIRVAFLYQIALIMFIASIYEIFEWSSIFFTEKVTGLTYVGAQGDEWDAQADMLSCLFGSVASLIFYLIIERRKIFR